MMTMQQRLDWQAATFAQFSRTGVPILAARPSAGAAQAPCEPSVAPGDDAARGPPGARRFSDCYRFSPDQVRTAYGIIGDGTGQTIAIIDALDDPKFVNSTDPTFNNSDLHKFDQQFNLPDPPSFTKVNQFGQPGPLPEQADAAQSGETALDVEWAHAIAPNASIILVEANS